MHESLKLRQGPGLNGLFIPAAPLSWKYDELENTATYVLQENYTLHICGYPLKDPSVPPLKPETYKLLDILVCKLGDSESFRQVELPLEDFLRLVGCTVSEPNKNAVRSKLQENAALLKALSMDWTERDGRYCHQNVRLFDEIGYGRGRVRACFSKDMSLYLRGCPSLPLPLPLLAISGKSPHSYLLGRRCLVHNAANKGREWQPIRVRSLLATCPRIPSPEPEEKWSPSILERQVIKPFAAAMRILANSGILVWRFREPIHCNDYDGFADSMVEFRLPDDTIATPPAKSDAAPVRNPFDYEAFLALR